MSELELLKIKYDRLLRFASLAYDGYGSDCPVLGSNDLFKVLSGEDKWDDMCYSLKQIEDELKKGTAPDLL